MGSAHLATPWRNIDEGKLAETRGAIYIFHTMSSNILNCYTSYYFKGFFDSVRIKPYHLITLIFGTKKVQNA